MILIIVQPVLSLCSSNPLQTVYLSTSWILPVSSPANSYLDPYLTSKVTSFVSQTTDDDNWCTNDSDVFSAQPSDFCCSTADINNIAYQFAAKFITNSDKLLTNVLGTVSKAIGTCILVSNPNLSLVNEVYQDYNGNRSVWGIYYAVYKAVKATLPISQAITCLICADDGTIGNYQNDNGSILVAKSAYNTAVSGYSNALYDFNNAAQKVVQFILNIYNWYLIDNQTSGDSCFVAMKNIANLSRFCFTLQNCTVVAQLSIANTALEFESLSNFIATGKADVRTLAARQLVTVTDNDGVGASGFSGILDSVTVNGADSKALAQAFGRELISIFLLFVATN